jgi:hypothetical protein
VFRLLAGGIISTVVAALCSVPANADPAMGEGPYLVNRDVTPGTYTAYASFEHKTTGCSWQRISQDMTIIEQRVNAAKTFVTIQPTDYVFNSYGCGDWYRV